jgi:hypothetical protein
VAQTSSTRYKVQTRTQNCYSSIRSHILIILLSHLCTIYSHILPFKCLHYLQFLNTVLVLFWNFFRWKACPNLLHIACSVSMARISVGDSLQFLIKYLKDSDGSVVGDRQFDWPVPLPPLVVLISTSQLLPFLDHIWYYYYSRRYLCLHHGEELGNKCCMVVATDYFFLWF